MRTATKRMSSMRLDYFAEASPDKAVSDLH